VKFSKSKFVFFSFEFEFGFVVFVTRLRVGHWPEKWSALVTVICTWHAVCVVCCHHCIQHSCDLVCWSQLTDTHTTRQAAWSTRANRL